jgi:hypothetical protein
MFTLFGRMYVEIFAFLCYTVQIGSEVTDVSKHAVGLDTSGQSCAAVVLIPLKKVVWKVVETWSVMYNT